MTLMKVMSFCAALTIALGGCRGHVDARSLAWTAGTSERDVLVGGDTRSYVLHLPTRVRRNRLGATVAYPLVLVLHGSGADGSTVEMQSGMDHLADSAQFIVAYPNGATMLFGLGSDWNAGKCCGNAVRSNVDDLAFLRATVDDVARHVPVDRRRIYVAGFSDGGRMAYHVACDAASMVAAIGVVAGSVVDDSCVPSRPVPVIVFHGTADDEVPFSAAPEANTATPLLPAVAPPSVRFWATTNRCQQATTRLESPHVTRVQFASCAADVVFYNIDGGGHAWPGGRKDGDGGAEPTSELNASAAMIRFFLRHAMR
jgi:polyhydroxybutyrate depolymerase